MAETPRFELGVRDEPHDALARRWFKPLTHVSADQQNSGGSGGIRTPGRRKPTTVFKTVAFNHSATLPQIVEIKNISSN